MPGSDTVQFTLTSEHIIFLPLCDRGSTPLAQGLLEGEGLKRAPQTLFPGEPRPAEDWRIIYLPGISLSHVSSLGTTLRWTILDNEN